MERYRIEQSPMLLVIHKRWTAYLFGALSLLGSLAVVLFFATILTTPRRESPSATMLELDVLVMGAATLGCAAWLVWRLSTGGAAYRFDARLKMFEVNRKVVAHFHAIEAIQFESVAHRRSKDSRNIGSLYGGGEDYRYTYRAVVIHHGGRRTVIDECGDQVDVKSLVKRIAAFTGVPITDEVIETAF